MDESSCYFAHDEDGDHVVHGHYFEEFGIAYDLSYYGWYFASSLSGPSAEHHTDYASYSTVFEGGDWSVYPDRRKVSGLDLFEGLLAVLHSPVLLSSFAIFCGIGERHDRAEDLSASSRTV